MSTQLFDNNNNKPEIVINATKMSSNNKIAEVYDFVLDLDLNIISCSYIKSISLGEADYIKDYHARFSDDLFELNHVRVNPKLNNTEILNKFKQELINTGVDIIDPPDEVLMSMCYRPIGELNDIVRFHLDRNNHSKLVFMSKRAKLSLV